MSRSAEPDLDRSRTTTDEEGAFTFEGLVPGSYQASARKPDRSALGSAASSEFVGVEVEGGMGRRSGWSSTGSGRSGCG